MRKLSTALYSRLNEEVLCTRLTVGALDLITLIIVFSQQAAVLRGKARPVSWGPGEIRQALKKQNAVDVAFKEKHQNYEQLQLQATKVWKLIANDIEN